MLRSFSIIPLSLWTLIFSLIPPAILSGNPSLSRSVTNINHQHRAKRTEGGVHLPLHRREARRQGLQIRDGKTAAIGLGDYVDVTYNVLVTVGGTETSLVLDTGSSDLWVISDACTTNCTSPSNVPLYPQSTFKPDGGLAAHLLYGDSYTGTHAYGPIGTDTVGVAGLTVQNQYFAAINNTNTSVLETGSAGILGMGFPVNSVIWTEVFSSEHPANSSSKRELASSDPSHPIPLSPPSLATRFFPSFNFRRPSFPSLSSLLHPSSSSSLSSRQQSSTTSIIPTILSSFSTLGPLTSRLVATGVLSAPMFTVTLQRDTVDIGGNVGMLSLGELPAGVANNSLTWAPVRGYTVSEGGLAAPSDSPNEVYPIAWEIPIDNVYFDGKKLAGSTLLSPNISLSALVDTGNSLIRGPSDVVQNILNTLGTGGRFPCSSNHTLAFEIGGQLFPVDPRDFATQAYTNSVSECVSNLAATDTPQEGNGYLYSWSLGDPFLKSVLASFYYGNLSYPSQDPPRIGFLSTVPPDAGNEMQAAVSTAAAGNGNFASTSDPAPTGTFTAASTGKGGVPQAQPSGTSSKGKSSGARTARPVSGSFDGWVAAGTVVLLTAMCS